jgi:hypothetical protein
MKQLEKPVRIYDADTLEYIGGYDKGRVGIMDENELVLDFHRYWSTWLIIALVMLGTLAINWYTSNRYSAVMDENRQLKEYIEVAEYDLNIEILAGRYATSRTTVPDDLDEVYKMCVQSGAWYPEIIMAQFIIESASGKSFLAKKARNFYGMKYIGTKGRPTLQIPNMNTSGYGMYLNWQHSILDRVLWDDWRFNKTKPQTREQYLNRIDGVYAEDPNYIAKVVKIAAQWETKTDSIRNELNKGTDTVGKINPI